MFQKIFIEKDLVNNEKARSILKSFPKSDVVEINQYDEIWGKVKKPYLQKRDRLNLFLANKKGQLVKEAPAAYGHGKEKHFYFIHAYNCIYECQYCYLQGYFNTPDIVLFLNHEDIIKEMQLIVQDYPDAWFHAGEYSDSLSLTHITKELEVYFEFFYKNPKAKLELRSKSANIKEVLKLRPAPNIFTSFTLSSTDSAKTFDFKCPSVMARLKSIEKLVQAGHMIGIHFDPIIYHDNFEESYAQIIKELSSILPNSQLGYISIGVVRFTKDVFFEVQKNYPNSLIAKQDYQKSFDGKLRYNHPMRMWIMNKVKDFLLKHYDEQKIYFCMEESDN